jgi:hypothetical protein
VPIDNSHHDFDELARCVLPSHFSRLQEAMLAPIPAEQLVGFQSATREALRRVGRTEDFPGCYVFLDAGKPVYVGIS